MKYNRLKPYIRRMQCDDYALNGDIFMNSKLSSFSLRGRNLYVLAIHGLPNAVLAIHIEKVGIKKAINEMNHHRVSFKQWCRDMRKQNKERGI